MTATALKKELYKAISNIEDGPFLQAVYTIINDKRREQEYDLSPEQWTEIEHVQKEHKAGKSKNYSWEEVKGYAKSKLKK